MIVRPHPLGWRVTLHPAHGLLAAELYAQLPPEASGVSTVATLIAVADHDDHQLDFEEGDYLTEAGAPQDFTFMKMDDEYRSKQAAELLKGVRRKGRWLGRLAGRHYRFLYAGQTVDNHMRQLLSGIDAFEAKTDLSRGEPDAVQLDITYGRMQFCDRLSLILAGEELPALGREVEINDGLGEVTYVCQDTDTDVVAVRPWPFVKSDFEVVAESMVLNQLTFKSSAALGKAIAKAKSELRHWKLAKP